MRKTTTNGSKVCDRVDWLIGQMVQVVVAPGFGEDDRSSVQFTALFQELLPLGSEYFFKFRLENGTIRLIRTRSVVEVQTL